MICNYMNYNVLIALVSTSVLQNFWRNLPLKGSIPGTYPSSRKLDHAFSSASRRFSVYLGSRTRSPRPKSHNFLKMEKAPPGIHPSYKCAKFYTFDDLWFPQSAPKIFDRFKIRNGSPASYIKIFKKRKKYSQGFTQAISVPNFRQI